MLENLTRANERYVAFGFEIVIENRVCVRFSEETVWSVIGGRTREAPVCDDKFNRVEHIQEETSSMVCGWGGGSWRGLFLGSGSWYPRIHSREHSHLRKLKKRAFFA